MGQEEAAMIAVGLYRLQRRGLNERCEKNRQFEKMGGREACKHTHKKSPEEVGDDGRARERRQLLLATNKA